jgi:hypothetical protein
MSDHTGSYMLNEILELMDQTQIFNLLGQEKTQTFIRDMLKISCRNYDCNAGEILDGLTDRFEICYCCRKSTRDLNQGLCSECGGDENFDFEL